MSPKKAFIQKLQKLEPSQLVFDTFIQKVFSILQTEVDFEVCWYSPVEPASLHRDICKRQIWNGSPPRVKKEAIEFGDAPFPSVTELLEMPSTSIRGEAFWDTSLFTKKAVYETWLKPLDLFFSFISLVFNDENGCIGYFVLWKSQKAGRFEEKDVSILLEFLPLVGRLMGKAPDALEVKNGKKHASPSPARLFHPIEQITGINEEELYSLIRRRAQPGILILSSQGEIRYSNHDARDFLEKLTAKPTQREQGSPEQAHKKNGVTSRPGSKKTRSVHRDIALPKIVFELYDYFTKTVAPLENPSENATPTVNRICIQGGMVYLLRALRLDQHDADQDPSEMMILIERVSHGVRVDQIGETTKLTPRESDVVQLLLEGKTNKEVAVCIDIGEYTVKDHIKRIMKKLDVTTRAGIVAKVLQSHFPD